METFSKLSSLLLRALETREPTVDLLESFVDNWKSITNYYIQTTDDSRPVRQTEIPWCLRQMLDILVYEEKQQVEDTGPCLEYLLQHKLLETLCTLGKAQYPPGMIQQVLLFFSKLLSQIQKPLLQLIAVYRPVQKLIGLCALPGSHTEKEEAQFLLVVCSRVKQDPHTLRYLLQVKVAASNHSKELLLPPSQSDSATDSPVQSESGLLSALLQLAQSQTASVCLKAFESLLLLSALQTESSGELLADHTQLGELLTGRLLQLYALLPLESLDAGELQSWPHTPWSSQFSHCRSDLSSKSSSSNQMNNFFSWLDFLDHLMREAPQVLAVKIAQCVHRFWLFDILQPQLLHTCEQVVLVSTSILCVAVRLVKSWSLLDQLVHFLLKTPPLPELLLQRCDHISDQISLASLCLVEELLQKPHRDILEVLVVTFLQSRSYLSAPAAGQEDTPLQSNQANEDSDDLEEDPFFSDSLLFSDSLPPPPLSSASSSAAPPSGLGSAADVVNSFLCLVPVQVRSAQLLQEGGFESYVHDAHTQVTQCESLSLSWDWPLSLPSSSGEGEEFFEGHLLKVLFDRLGRVLEQPYELNLRLTAVLSRLSAFNHPLLQEYLLDPYIHLSHCSRSLFSVLIRLMGELMQRVQLVSNLTDRLLNTRRDLLGLNHDIGLEHLTLLRGLVVLEEFCQELAAIAFVKLPKDQVVTPLDQQGLAWTSRDSPGPVVNPPDQQ
ncbi:FHF complex subunit HOOK-interacting protein 2B isoform X2 [Pseudoliparis swirei]|uniref:FHF complex subunit HOOK-interacting protein 2B isoform X2 n=1 Tax=Pseudoliparis swirei TaxID=2059687 RepID=UPI0024BEBEF4|nr:FHF complex subunit HOOK-interacting protein 2B isoform X2 [Pseudoliparis swirei]